MSLPIRYAIVAAATLGLALLVVLIGSVDLLHESPSGVVAILRYVGLSAGIALGVGLAGVVGGLRTLPRLSHKIAMVYAIGSIAAILTVIYTPLLMFKDQGDLRLLVLLLVCFLVVSLGIGTMLALGVAARIRALQAAVRGVADRHFDTRVKLDSGDELSDLAEGFNSMAEELGTAFERMESMERGRRMLIAAISHDLRTPLASIRAMLEAIEDRVVQDDETIREYHAAMGRQVRRLNRLIDDLFEVTRLESGTLEVRRQPIDLVELVAETADGLRLEAEQKQVEIALSHQGGSCRADVDPDQIQRVVANILQNSVRYTPPGGRIEARVECGDSDITIEVVDSGPGISPGERSEVFKPFYRGEKERSSLHGGGAGLGLAIAKRIVEAHGGRIWVDSKSGTGGHVAFALPLEEVVPSLPG